MFATFILYFTLAQQSILEIAKEASDDFHQYSGWPMISSGPGGGPYLHPLYMLEYAGLAPTKYEAPLLLEMAKHYFPYLRQEMNTIPLATLQIPCNCFLECVDIVELLQDHNRYHQSQTLCLHLLISK